MINHDQIEEWIHEVEERPSSGPLILRFMANRLRDLTSRNEELLAENISLRSGRKVEEYESRIATLEYQLEMLRRQVGGEMNGRLPTPAVEEASIIVYRAQGQVVRMQAALEGLQSGTVLANVPRMQSQEEIPPRILITSPTEELLFVFDSGRTESMPVSALPCSESEKPDWKKAFLVEPRGGEELAAVLPMATMSLYDYCVQTSRRGCAKKMMRTSFETHVSKNFIGTGVKAKPDRTGGMVLCGKEDLLVLASWEGFVTCADVSGLAYTAEELLRLSATDHIVSSFVTGQKPALVAITLNGKAVVRETGRLEKPASSKGRGQPIFSASRRDSGIRVAGAAAVDENDWGAVLTSDGRIVGYRMGEVIAAGSLGESVSSGYILDFVPFGVSVAGQTTNGKEKA